MILFLKANKDIKINCVGYEASFTVYLLYIVFHKIIGYIEDDDNANKYVKTVSLNE